MTIPIYAFNLKKTAKVEAGVYFTVADLPSNAVVQTLFAADDKNRDVIKQFAKEAGFTSVSDMCTDLDKGAQLIPDIMKLIEVDPIINFTICDPTQFHVDSLVGAEVKGLLPNDPEEFLEWYESRID